MIDLTKYTKYEPGDKKVWARECERLIRLMRDDFVLITYIHSSGNKMSKAGVVSIVRVNNAIYYKVTGGIIPASWITAIYVPHALDGWKVFEKGVCEPEEGQITKAFRDDVPMLYGADLKYHTYDFIGDNGIRISGERVSFVLGDCEHSTSMKPGDTFREV